MTPTKLPPDEFKELEQLLPWYVSGTLDEEERARVEQALASNETLRGRLQLVREELGETVLANEALGAPGPQTFDRMMDMIDAEPLSPRTIGSVLRGLKKSVDEFFASLAPQTIRLGAGLAAVVIVAQGVILGSTLLSDRSGSRYVSASGGAGETVGAGTFALVKFADRANAADIAALLRELKASIIAGPKPGGIYKLRLSSKVLSATEKAKAMATLRNRKNVVELVLPAGPGK